LDYLLLSRFGVRAESDVVAMLGSGNFDLAHLGPADLLASRRIIEHYDDQVVGATDASIVVLADRYGTDRVCTLDRRHFSVLRAFDGAAFTVLP
jgi:predicted nucleic acid-binding protein